MLQYWVDGERKIGGVWYSGTLWSAECPSFYIFIMIWMIKYSFSSIVYPLCKTHISFFIMDIRIFPYNMQYRLWMIPIPSMRSPFSITYAPFQAVYTEVFIYFMLCSVYSILSSQYVTFYGGSVILSYSRSLLGCACIKISCVYISLWYVVYSYPYFHISCSSFAIRCSCFDLS